MSFFTLCDAVLYSYAAKNFQLECEGSIKNEYRRDVGIPKSLILHGSWDSVIRDKPSRLHSMFYHFSNLLPQSDGDQNTQERHSMEMLTELTTLILTQESLLCFKIENNQFYAQWYNKDRNGKKGSPLTIAIEKELEPIFQKMVMFAAQKNTFEERHFNQCSFPVQEFIQNTLVNHPSVSETMVVLEKLRLEKLIEPEPRHTAEPRKRRL